MDSAPIKILRQDTDFGSVGLKIFSLILQGPLGQKCSTEDPQVKSKARTAEFKTSLCFCPVTADSVILYVFFGNVYPGQSVNEHSVDLIKLICKSVINASFSCYPLEGQ